MLHAARVRHCCALCCTREAAAAMTMEGRTVLATQRPAALTGVAVAGTLLRRAEPLLASLPPPHRMRTWKGFVYIAKNGELSRALVSAFPARSWLSKIHGGLWRKGEFSALMEGKMHLFSFGAHWVIVSTLSYYQVCAKRVYINFLCHNSWKFVGLP